MSMAGSCFPTRSSVVAAETAVALALHLNDDACKCPRITIAVPPYVPDVELVLGLAAVQHALKPALPKSASTASSFSAAKCVSCNA